MLNKLFTKKLPISQEFGNNPDMYKRFGLIGHNGVDFATPVGTPILATIDGYVEIGNDYKGYGKYIKIFRMKHDGGTEVIYGHLSEINVKMGDIIKVGQVLGKTGNTGNSTGPHLHFGLRFRDVNKNIVNLNNGYKGWVNPMTYFVGF